MSLARFYSRIHDAISPLLQSSTNLEEYLSQRVVCLEATNELENHPIHLSGFVFAANLCARLYPRLRLVGPRRVTDECASIALQINPSCEIETTPGNSDAYLTWGARPSNQSAVCVSPAGWNVFIDLPNAQRVQPTNILTSLAAAALAVGEMFRVVFAQFLPSGRVRPMPGNLNLLTLTDSQMALPDLPSKIDIGQVHLAGAGAIGEAMVYALARVSATGTLVVVDPERITLSNLQRYVLALDSDVAVSKCSLISRALKGSLIETLCRELAWGTNPEADEEIHTVCAAVDSASTRIAIQAGLPRVIYNAWTQPADIGWSRHESFGENPCLACLYWPTRPRLNEHESIALSIQEHELRVLAYLTHRIPVDMSLRPEQIPRLSALPVPPDSSLWVEHPILDDIANRFGIETESLLMWKGMQLTDLYREGICGGAIVRRISDQIPQEFAVPLAHQSALAGIMLAGQLLIARSPELIPFRPSHVEARLDVLTALSQLPLRPRQRTQNCLCSDPDFVHRYREKWRQKKG